jgi:hypothetical protein
MNLSEIAESSGMRGNLNEAGDFVFGARQPNPVMKKSCGVPAGDAGYTSQIHDLRGGSSAGRVAAGSTSNQQEVIEGYDEIE